MICSFFGHRNIKITEQMKSLLKNEIEKIINIGYSIFYFGGFGDFDENSGAYKVMQYVNKKHKNFLNIADL